MTVRELINRLLEMPMDSDILIGTTKNCCHVTPISNNTNNIDVVELSAYSTVYIVSKDT